VRKQIHKRLPKDFVEDVMRTFCEEKIGREQACELLELSRSELYWWREKYLASAKKKKEFKLYNREAKPTRSFTLSFLSLKVSCLNFSLTTFLYIYCTS